jgi:8-oxo-dGTP pyrophosphatase MutT (NUDIX family)
VEAPAPRRSSAPAPHALRPGDPELAPCGELARAVATIAAYAPADDGQRAARERILAFAAVHPDALHRSCRRGHLTASALVVDPQARVLLTLHRKLGRWLQLGGHCDGDATLPGVALREAVEESGIAELVVVPRILDLDVHTIPARAGEPEHLHLDVRFLVLAPAGAEPVASSESRALRWFSPSELAALELDASLRRLVARARRGE